MHFQAFYGYHCKSRCRTPVPSDPLERLPNTCSLHRRSTARPARPSLPSRAFVCSCGAPLVRRWSSPLWARPLWTGRRLHRFPSRPSPIASPPPRTHAHRGALTPASSIRTARPSFVPGARAATGPPRRASRSARCRADRPVPPAARSGRAPDRRRRRQGFPRYPGRSERPGVVVARAARLAQRRGAGGVGGVGGAGGAAGPTAALKERLRPWRTVSRSFCSCGEHNDWLSPPGARSLDAVALAGVGGWWGGVSRADRG